MAGPIQGNTFRVSYEFTNGNRFTGQTVVAAAKLEDAATLAASPEGQALFSPPLPTNFTAFALTGISRIEVNPDQVVINETS